MARSCSNSKLVTALITRAITGRGFASAEPQAVVSAAADNIGGHGSGVTAAKRAGETAAGEKVSWVPDPRTGFFRPANAAEEIDVAELRNMLLKKQYS